jgi:hypothetical protein
MYRVVDSTFTAKQSILSFSGASTDVVTIERSTLLFDNSSFLIDTNFGYKFIARDSFLSCNLTKIVWDNTRVELGNSEMSLTGVKGEGISAKGTALVLDNSTINHVVRIHNTINTIEIALSVSTN